MHLNRFSAQKLLIEFLYLKMLLNTAGVEEVVVIDQDCSPHGPQQFVLWNPPLVSRKFSLNPANGGGYSRTEGRARKGEIRCCQPAQSLQGLLAFGAHDDAHCRLDRGWCKECAQLMSMGIDL